jgi:hypothetical protein
MKRELFSGLALLSALLAVAATPAAARTHHAKPIACPPHGGKVLTADVQATVYEATLNPGAPEYLDAYGCTRGSAHDYKLGVVPECGPFEPCGAGECDVSTVCVGIRHEVLAGTVVAYEDFDTTPTQDEWFVVVRELRDGRTLLHTPTGIFEPGEHSPKGVGPIVSVLVKSDGTVAWLTEDLARMIQANPNLPEIHYYDVYVAEHAASPRLIASGTDISPGSLALAGDTLYWTQGGEPSFTQLK